MMRLYHAGYEEITDPDIHRGRKNADFGQGFYLTADYEFASRWVRERDGHGTIINVYELDESKLKIKSFERDAEWFGYIFSNRRGKADALSEYDIITGPIANDTIFNTLGIMTSGYLSDEEALELLCVGPLYRQTVIKTQTARDCLKFVSSTELPKEAAKTSKETFEKEEESYLEQIAEVMKRF